MAYWLGNLFCLVFFRVFLYFVFYRLFEEKVGIGLPLMEEVNAESELSLRFELWGVRKSHS